jgi:hypothetical protein
MGRMKKAGAIITAIALILGAILLFIMVNQFIDRLSRWEDQWTKRTQAIEQLEDLPSSKPSKGD